MRRLSNQFDNLFKLVSELQEVEKLMEQHPYASEESNRLEDKMHAILLDIKVETRIASIHVDSDIAVYRETVVPFRLDNGMDIHLASMFDKERGRK